MALSSSGTVQNTNKLKVASQRISEMSMETLDTLAAPTLKIDGSTYLIPISSHGGSNGEVCRLSVVNQSLKIDWYYGGAIRTSYIDFNP